MHGCCTPCPTRALTSLCALILLCLCIHPSTASWLFHPTGTDAATDFSAPAVDDTQWQPVTLPHRDWDDIQGSNNVYGWYRCRFTLPEACAGSELTLKLGIVDDTDWTFVNGTQIGTTAAYDAERVYVIPADVVHPGENVIAVKVYDIIGTGGLLSDPRLGVRLAHGGNWLFMAGDAPEPASWAATDLDETDWQSVAVPDEEWDKRQPGDNVYGWYRLPFSLPEGFPATEQVLDLGIVCDVDQAFLNGTLIGETGHFPPEYASVAGEPRLYAIPDGLLRPGDDNVLAVRVFNGEAKGGIQGEPALFIPIGEPDAAAATLQRARALRHAGKLDEARGLVDALLPAGGAPAVIAKALDELTVLQAARGQGDEALATFETMLREYPLESCTGDAVRAVCAIQAQRGSLSEHAACLGEDRVTRGDWWLRYGNNGLVLCTAGGDCDVYGLPGTYAFSDPNIGNPDRWSGAPFGYRALRCVDEGHPTAYNWVAAVTTTDQRALYNPLIRTRTCAWWDDKGETHPFDNQGPDLKVPIELPEGQWRLSAYLVDYDWHSTWHPRRHGLVLTDDGGGLLAVADTGKFGSGVWQRFILRGPQAVTLRICKNASSSAILSALMLDRVPPLMPVEACGLAPDRASLPQEALAEYQGVSDLLASSSIQYSRRLEEIATGGQADPAGGLQAGLRAWLQWQAALWAYRDEATTAALLDAYITALRGTVGDSEMPPALDAQVELLMASRQLAAAQALDARRSDLLTGAEAGLENVQTMQKLIDRWLPVDDRFATRAFEKQVHALVEGPPDVTLPILATLVEAYADQGRELMPEISGPYRPMVAGHPKAGPLAEPVGIPGFGAIVLDALKALPRDVALQHFTPFLRRWGERERLAVLKAPGLAPEERLRRFDAVIEQTLGEPRVTASVRSNCVRVLAESGRIDEALAASVELWAMSPEDMQQWGQVNLSLGEALARRGRYAEAVPVYRQVVDRYRETEPAGARAALKALAELARLQGDADAEAKARAELEALKTP